VTGQAQNLEEHRGLRTHIAKYFSGVKSLIACALKHVEVGWCPWRASLPSVLLQPLGHLSPRLTSFARGRPL